jgi:hypothetical protein
MPAPRNVISAINADMRLQNRLFEAVQTDSTRYKRALESALTRRVQGLITDDRGRILPDIENSQILDISQSEIRDIMEDAGLSQYASRVTGNIDRRARTANDLFKRIGLENGIIDDLENLPLVTNRISSVSRRLGAGSERAANEIEKAFWRFRQQAEMGERITRSQMANTISSRAGILSAYGHTIVNTELAGVDREIKIEQTRKAGVNQMKYLGPDDRVTRPWCQEHLDQVRTIEYWQDVQNDTGPNPPSEYGGGYNCRHRLITWLPEWD